MHWARLAWQASCSVVLRTRGLHGQAVQEKNLSTCCIEFSETRSLEPLGIYHSLYGLVQPPHNRSSAKTDLAQMLYYGICLCCASPRCCSEQKYFVYVRCPRANSDERITPPGSAPVKRLPPFHCLMLAIADKPTSFLRNDLTNERAFQKGAWTYAAEAYPCDLAPSK